MLGYDTLRIELEDASEESRRPEILAILGGTYGSVTLRFVGVADGERRHVGTVFLSQEDPSITPPREEWAPGLNAALAGLRREIEAAGWEYLGQGEQLWDLFYRRPRWE